MPPRLRNPLRGSLHPWALSKRITDFLLALIATIFISTNARIFSRILRRQTGLLDPRILPFLQRRIAITLCYAGTFFLYASIVYLFAARWEFLSAIAAAACAYLLSALALSRGIWVQPIAFRVRARLHEVLRNTWEVIRNGHH
jgi:hypothetical protein